MTKHSIEAHPAPVPNIESGSAYIGLKQDRCFPDLDDLGLRHPDYRPLFLRRDQYIDSDHRSIANWREDGALVCGPVPGFLRKADALLLYELAYHAVDDVLETGSAWGLSTGILALAIRNAHRRTGLVSVDLSPQFHEATKVSIARIDAVNNFEALLGDAGDVLASLAGQERHFGLAFIDHDHSLTATYAVCNLLPRLIRHGGFVVFHDFNDERNRDPQSGYGVYQGVAKLLKTGTFCFEGTLGCCGILRRG